MINNATDWWKAIEDNWDNLFEIFAHHLILEFPAYQVPGDATSQPSGRNQDEELQYLKTNRDPKLARYLCACWGLASDAYAYSVPGWGILCDLCSEEWVLHESEI